MWPFKSARNRWRDEAKKLFDVAIDCFNGLEEHEIGGGLDLAKNIKDSLILEIRPKDTNISNVFNDPMLVSEQASLDYLKRWNTEFLLTPARTIEDQATVGAVMIWWLSLAAGTVGELRFRGSELWGLLATGFPYCKNFDPKVDAPRGLEPRSSMQQHNGYWISGSAVPGPP